MAIGPDGDAMRAALTPYLAEICADAPPSLRMAPFFDELAQRAERTSWPEAIGAMPADWWHQLAAVGTPDDAAAYLAGLEAAGADAVALFPDPSDPLTDIRRAAGYLKTSLRMRASFSRRFIMPGLCAMYRCPPGCGSQSMSEMSCLKVSMASQTSACRSRAARLPQRSIHCERFSRPEAHCA